MTVKFLAPTKRAYKKVSEEQVQSALALYFDYQQNHCFRGVYMCEWESDFIVISKSMYAWEVEIKISMGDWKVDADKAKWQSKNWKYVNRFYYAVPAKLLRAGIPSWVPEWAGVLELRLMPGGRLRVWEVRKPTALKGEKVSPSMLHNLYRSTYFRFWRNQALDPDAVGVVDCRDLQMLQLVGAVDG
jgi:hypothetical protein